MTQKRFNTNLIAKLLLLTSIAIASLPQAYANQADDNKAIVVRYLDGLFNKSNFALTDKLVSAKFVDHGNGTKESRGREDLKNEVVFYRQTFPDLHVILTHIVAEGDKVAYQFRSTSAGVKQGGKPFFLTGMIIDRLENGKIIERWENYDELGAMKYFEPLSKKSKKKDSNIESVLPHKKK